VVGGHTVDPPLDHREMGVATSGNRVRQGHGRHRPRHRPGSESERPAGVRDELFATWARPDGRAHRDRIERYRVRTNHDTVPQELVTRANEVDAAAPTWA
jgi:hypothetical protein